MLLAHADATAELDLRNAVLPKRVADQLAHDESSQFEHGYSLPLMKSEWPPQRFLRGGHSTPAQPDAAGGVDPDRVDACR